MSSSNSVSKPLIPLSIFLSKLLVLIKKLQFTQDGMNFVKIYKKLGLNDLSSIELFLPLYSTSIINVEKIFNPRTFLKN